MTSFGLDFGGHAASIAIWYEDQDKVEVIADDLGFRTIPCAVAFRQSGDDIEILTGQSAVSQAHKNSANTFLDVRLLLLDESTDQIYVPVLEKELSVIEIASHFFRNIYNQIKQQVGTPVKDCVVSVPPALDADNNMKQRLIDSAQMGGCRVKSTITDSASVLNAFEMDSYEHNNNSQTVVIDLGWNSTKIATYDISNGLYFLKSFENLETFTGKVLVQLLTAHCVKDFLRKNKCSCEDSKRAIVRLERECENAMRTLSMGSEAMIDIDSLFEGIDYSTKISRARFEDLISIPFMQFKNALSNLMQNIGYDENVTDLKIVLVGGLHSVPKCTSMLKSLYPNAFLVKSRNIENAEAQAVGAAMQGKYLAQSQLLSNIPKEGPELSAILKSTISIQNVLNKDNATKDIIVIKPDTPLPTNFTANLSLPEKEGCLTILADGDKIASIKLDASESILVNVSINKVGKIRTIIRDETSNNIIKDVDI